MFEAIRGFFAPAAPTRAQAQPVRSRPVAPAQPTDHGIPAEALNRGQLRHQWESLLGQTIVQDARHYQGQPSQTLKGKLPNFQAAGGNTNNCADFVSSNLMNRGALKGKQVNVDRLRAQLEQEGYHQVPASQAKPGDVLFFKDKRHTELVSQAGGKMAIGSNNFRPGNPNQVVHGQQWVSEHAIDPTQVTYYSLH